MHAKHAQRSPTKMIVFDVDGTLVGGEAADWNSFEAAFEEVAGFVLEREFFASLEEITAQAIVHHALADLPFEEKRLKERAVSQGYLRRLKAAHKSDGQSFLATEGAVDLLHALKKRNIPIAIATGDWRESISFKLHSAGIPFEGIPLVTSSEHYSRADIIAAAVAEAGQPIEEAIYVGDGLWDLRACRKLGIPFIGVGKRRQKLRDAGAEHILTDLNPTDFFQAREAAKRQGPL